jgi:hypothetical protein
MWRKVRIAAMAISAYVLWSAMVTLGFGGHLWPILASGRYRKAVY